jgi:hypothetical protein
MKYIAQQNMKVGAEYQPWLNPVKFNNLTEFDKINSDQVKTYRRNKMQWVTYACPEDNSTCIDLISSIPTYYNTTVLFHPDPINDRSKN